MSKTILITGSTDGIGLETARKLHGMGHKVLLHGRNPSKLDAAAEQLGGIAHRYVADLSDRAGVKALADAVTADHDTLDVLINNAGILKTRSPILANGLDSRFVVNTLAPHELSLLLLPLIPADGRIVNLSSAAQSPVDTDALMGRRALSDMDAYSQSKLALTMMSRHLASQLPDGPAVIAVNPGSLLASKMVKDGFGVAGNDLGIGADILCRAALSDEFANASGQYFDNDAGRFGQPHPDAMNAARTATVVKAVEAVLGGLR